MIRVAAIALPFTYIATPQEFTDLVRAPIEAAARAGAQLVVLPNYFSYALLGMFIVDADPGAPLAEIARLVRAESVPALMRSRAPYIYDLHVHIFGSLAERTGMWLAPGTVPEINEGNWYNTALLFSPDGKIFGRQRQTHRAPEERTFEMGVSDELKVFNTSIGRIGFVIGHDVRYPEVSRILALQGANILIHPADGQRRGDAGTRGRGDTEQEDAETRRRGDAETGDAEIPPDEQFLIDLWREVQSNQVFGVQANLVGEAFRGRSAIYAPVEMTEGHRGILAQAHSDAKAEIVSAELDFNALQQVIDAYPIFDFFNYEFYKAK